MQPQPKKNYSQETEAEQPQMEVTETAAEPDMEQETEEEQSQMEVTEADAGTSMSLKRAAWRLPL